MSYQHIAVFADSMGLGFAAEVVDSLVAHVLGPSWQRFVAPASTALGYKEGQHPIYFEADFVPRVLHLCQDCPDAQKIGVAVDMLRLPGGGVHTMLVDEPTEVM